MSTHGAAAVAGASGDGDAVVRPDAGSVTAELAVALPAVVLVLAACVGGLQVAAAQVRLQDAAALAARSAARGDEAGVAAIGGSVGAVIATRREGGFVCATARSIARWGPGLPPLAIVAESCALADGR